MTDKLVIARLAGPETPGEVLRVDRRTCVVRRSIRMREIGESPEAAGEGAEVSGGGEHGRE